jgi:hypothetical protein
VLYYQEGYLYKNNKYVYKIEIKNVAQMSFAGSGWPEGWK